MTIIYDFWQEKLRRTATPIVFQAAETTLKAIEIRIKMNIRLLPIEKRLASTILSEAIRREPVPDVRKLLSDMIHLLTIIP